MSMLGSLTSAVSGLDNFQEEMNVIGNNIANVDTTGFKAASVQFADAFSETLRAASGATSSGRFLDSLACNNEALAITEMPSCSAASTAQSTDLAKRASIFVTLQRRPSG